MQPKQAVESSGATSKNNRSVSKRTTFRPSRYVLQQEVSKTSIKRREISVGKSRNLTSANGSKVERKGGKESKESKESKETVRKQECRRKEEGGEKDAAGDTTEADFTTNRAIDGPMDIALSVAAVTDKEEKQESQPQQNSSQVVTASGSTSEKEEFKDLRLQARVRSLSESAVETPNTIQDDFLGDAGREMEGKNNLEEGRIKAPAEQEKDEEIGKKPDDAGREANGEKEEKEEEQDDGAKKMEDVETLKCGPRTTKGLDEELLNKILEMEDEVEGDLPSEEQRKTRPRRRRRVKTKAKSLGRQDGVVRQMLVRGSKRPPMFPPSADAWPGRL